MKKIMKVMLCLTLIAALALTMVACGGSKSPEGKYVLKTLRADGDEADAQDALATKGLDASSMYYEFNKDGTGKAGNNGQEVDFTWEGTTMKFAEGSIDFEFKDGAVVIGEDGVEFVYKK